jgi:hypothetical protein
MVFCAYSFRASQEIFEVKSVPIKFLQDYQPLLLAMTNNGEDSKEHHPRNLYIFLLVCFGLSVLVRDACGE